MPETNTELPAEAVTKKEREFSPSQSDSERGDTPRDLHVGVSTKWPLPLEAADKLEKIKLLRRISIVKNPRILELANYDVSSIS